MDTKATTLTGALRCGFNQTGTKLHVQLVKANGEFIASIDLNAEDARAYANQINALAAVLERSEDAKKKGGGK